MPHTEPMTEGPHDPLDNVQTATVIRPGDRVLLTVSDAATLSHGAAEDMKARLGERFPGAEFTFVAGVSGVAIERSTDDTDTEG